MTPKKTTNTTKLIALNTDTNAEYEFSVKNNYEYRYQKRPIRIDLVQEADGVNVLSCDGMRYPYEITQQSANTYSITLNGVSYNFSIETPFSLSRKRMLAAKAGLSKKEVIKAPMPGKILDVFVTEGQTVGSGEALLVLEAMKMQNTISTHMKGTVTKVTVVPGKTVGKDDVLIEIKAED